MKRFIQRFSEKIIGVLSGFDRVVFRGTLRPIALSSGMMEFLWRKKILLKDFGEFSLGVSEQLKQTNYAAVTRENRPIVYLASNQENKEAIALRQLKEFPTQEGIICMIKCVEPGNSFQVTRNRETKKLQLSVRERMCLHLYLYCIDREFGFMNARIQTWFPFSIQICINGREWLFRQMQQAGGFLFLRADNSFPWINKIDEAQHLMDKQVKTHWPKQLNRLAEMLNPIHQKIFKEYPMHYYWTTAQTEWATDVMFKNASELAPIYRALTRHGINTFDSSDVMRFLGKRLYAHYQGELVSDYKRRIEGVRIKHRVGTNSIKAYDKQGTILRVETTINNPRDFKVFRPKEKDPDRTLGWQKLRQGIADLHRRVKISQASNTRYLDALSQVDTSVPFGQLLAPISRPTTWNGKRVRGLRPSCQDDLALFQAVTRGEFAINGFRNRDLQTLLFAGSAETIKQKKQRSARVSRLIRLLRAHHLVSKVSSTYRYVLTQKGERILRAVISLSNISLEQIYKATA